MCFFFFHRHSVASQLPGSLLCPLTSLIRVSSALFRLPTTVTLRDAYLVRVAATSPRCARGLKLVVNIDEEVLAFSLERSSIGNDHVHHDVNNRHTDDNREHDPKHNAGHRPLANLARNVHM